MPSKSKPLSKAELADFEAKRDFAADLLESVRQMKAGQVTVVSSPFAYFSRSTSSETSCGGMAVPSSLSVAFMGAASRV